jgi:predicted transcriptional regulator
MPHEAKQFDGPAVIFKVDAATDKRLEKIAPTRQGRRSEFCRRAILAELDRVEAEQADADQGAA